MEFLPRPFDLKVPQTTVEAKKSPESGLLNNTGMFENGTTVTDETPIGFGSGHGGQSGSRSMPRRPSLGNSKKQVKFFKFGVARVKMVEDAEREVRQEKFAKQLMGLPNFEKNEKKGNSKLKAGFTQPKGSLNNLTETHGAPRFPKN